jgi:hypothetical protein
VLVGWSGGAGYLGFHLGSLGSRVAAVAFVGGGSPGRCSKRKLPIHMISGEDNPHHDLMKATYSQLARCGHRVTWKRLPGKDHDDEWRILQRAETQRAIFDFLERYELRRRRANLRTARAGRGSICSGSMHAGSSCCALFTRVDTGSPT